MYGGIYLYLHLQFSTISMVLMVQMIFHSHVQYHIWKSLLLFFRDYLFHPSPRDFTSSQRGPSVFEAPAHWTASPIRQWRWCVLTWIPSLWVTRRISRFGHLEILAKQILGEEKTIDIWVLSHLFLTQREKSSLSKARTRQNESNAGVNMDNSTSKPGPCSSESIRVANPSWSFFSYIRNQGSTYLIYYDILKTGSLLPNILDQGKFGKSLVHRPLKNPNSQPDLKLVGWMIHATHLTVLNRAVLLKVGFRKSCVWSWGGVIWKGRKHTILKHQTSWGIWKTRVKDEWLIFP